MSAETNHDAQTTQSDALDIGGAEDLFAFDELSAPDMPASADAASAGAEAQDLNEDAMNAVLGPAPTPRAPIPSAAIPSPRRIGLPDIDALPSTDSASAPSSMVEPRPAHDAHASAASMTSVAQIVNARSSALLVAGIVLIGLSNLALVGVVWRSIDQARRDVVSNGSTLASATRESTHAVGSEQPVAHMPSAFDVAPEGEETIATAEQALARGDFGRTRELLSGLLAVADRLPERSRSDIEARASFLIAASWRAQADHVEAAARAKAETRGTTQESHR